MREARKRPNPTAASFTRMHRATITARMWYRASIVGVGVEQKA